MGRPSPRLFLVTRSLPYLFGVLPIPHLRPGQLGGGTEQRLSAGGGRGREFNFGGDDDGSDARRSHSEKQTVDTLSWLPYKTFQRTDERAVTPNVVVCISVAARPAEQI